MTAWTLRSALRAGVVCLFLGVLLPATVHAQFGDMRKRAAQAVLCAGGAFGGYKLGSKLAERHVQRLSLPADEAQKVTRAFQIGSALILCRTGALLAGTIYEKLSRRDLEARQREMEEAVAQAEPGTRTYVLPDSQLEGTITVEPSVVEDDRECRTAVDHLADAEGGEPVLTRFCRSLPDGQWELDY